MCWRGGGSVRTGELDWGLSERVLVVVGIWSSGLTFWWSWEEVLRIQLKPSPSGRLGAKCQVTQEALTASSSETCTLKLEEKITECGALEVTNKFCDTCLSDKSFVDPGTFFWQGVTEEQPQGIHRVQETRVFIPLSAPTS